MSQAIAAVATGPSVHQGFAPAGDFPTLPVPLGSPSSEDPETPCTGDRFCLALQPLCFLPPSIASRCNDRQIVDSMSTIYYIL